MTFPVPEGREDPEGRRAADIQYLFDMWVNEMNDIATWHLDEMLAVVNTMFLRLRYAFTSEELHGIIHVLLANTEELLTDKELVIRDPATGQELPMLVAEERRANPEKAELADQITMLALGRDTVPDTIEEIDA